MSVTPLILLSDEYKKNVIYHADFLDEFVLSTLSMASTNQEQPEQA